MDKPLSALDPYMRTKLQNEILTLHREFKTTTIMVSQDEAKNLKVGNIVNIGTKAFSPTIASIQ